MATPRVGDLVGGYRLLADLHVANGGNCKWTFAEKNGQEFFIKEFFSPKYPVKPMGSEKTMKAKHAACERFEAHQRALMAKAGAVAGAGGRLIVPIAFFRDGSTYYKVAPKVDATAMGVAEIAGLPFDQQQSILRAVVSALRALHRAEIVHGDLSPSNILLARVAGGDHKAHVIDFDSSFLSGDPPPVEELMGNPPYYSPEMLSYIQGELDDRTKLSTQSDIFALGLVFWQYLFGGLPKLAPHNYAAEAVRSGHHFSTPAGLPLPIAGLIESMLNRDPAGRPTMSQIQSDLKGLLRDDSTPPSPPPLPTPGSSDGRSRVRKSGSWPKTGDKKAEPPPPPTASRVRYKGKAP